ncbi:MAG: glycoside hydrolase family 2 protein [Acidobacteriota bacterium]
MWDFRLDPDGQGENGAWFAPVTTGRWKRLRVPGSFNEELAHHPEIPDPDDPPRFYKGKAWYRTRFEGPRAAGDDLFLHFSGTVLRQKVWLNGQCIGSSVLPWINVSYEVSRAILRGQENTLVVEVDNAVLPNAIPDAKWRGWWDDGGLIWPVYLEERAPVRSDDHATTTMLPNGQWRLQIHARIHEDTPAPASVLLSLADDRGHIVWHKTETAPASADDLSLTSTADLRGIHSWSPDHPALYALTVKTVANRQPQDVVSFHLGFRQIETRGSRIFLNGQPLTLRGINRHEFAPGVGQSMSAAQNLRDMTAIRALGANFVRLAHYSQSQDVYDDCDRLGLLVWTEMPAWQSAAATLASPEVWQNYAAPELDAMIHELRNHPSVILWSVANEIPSDKPEVADYVRKAIDYVHHLDPTRLATFASDKRERDISMAPVDVIAVNEYFGWYYGKLDDVGPMLDRMHAKYPDKPIVVSEFGSEAVNHWNPNTAKDGSKDYSDAFQVRFLSSHLKQIYAPERRSYVAGGIIWIYADFPDPHRINGDHPDIARYRNSKGLVTMDRQPKPSWAVVLRFYHHLMQETENGAATPAVQRAQP